MHPLEALQSLPVDHQRAPKMAPGTLGPDLVLDLDPNPGKRSSCFLNFDNSMCTSSLEMD